MLRSLCLAAALSVSAGALAQTPPAPKPKTKTRRPPQNPSAAQSKQPATSAGTGQQGTAASPATSQAPADAAAQGATPPAAQAPAPAASPTAAGKFDQEEFRRQVMEEVRRELQKTKDEVKQETAWVEQDSQARVQDSEAVESLKQRVNLFQPHGYLRMRGEFFHGMSLGRGPDPSGNFLFPGPFIGTGGNNSQSDANFRFRFEPTLEVSEDLSIHFQADILDNVLLGSSPVTDKYLDPFTPLSVLSTQRGAGVVNVKRVWGRVNTQLGELLFGRMGYHWGLGLLHNDGNCLDCDFGDTYDRIAFAPREFKGHHFALMFDILDKGATTTGAKGELGRSVDLDTLDDGYRIALEVTKVDTPDEVKRKLDNNQWVINYGVVGDYRVQAWDTPVTVLDGGNPRANVVQRGAKFYQPDGFLSLKRKKWRLDAELAFNIGSVARHQQTDFDPATSGLDAATLALITAPVNFFQVGGALQTDIALLSNDALLFGLEYGAASGDKGAFGFGARPWRSGSGALQRVAAGEQPFRTAGLGDIDGTHLDFSDPAHTHGRINNFIFNRSFNVDMILFRNLITSVTSAWYVKPSMRYRPTGRKTGGGDDTGFELLLAMIYSQAWYIENTPGQARPLGLEFNAGITYDTSDRFHAGLAYGLLVPFDGLRNQATGANPSIAHAVRMILAIPF
ncbi:MAG TPA: TIGR04551 family protein [Myxococcales bacterium]|nr:TIGR04551 family protein [Myxococcales bacterium]